MMEMVLSFCNFAAVYGLVKCLKAMLCGTVAVPVVFLLRRAFRGKNAAACCYCLLLLVPMAFMGMNRLFYQRYVVRVTALLYGYAKPTAGYLYFGVMFALFLHFIYRNMLLRASLKRCPQITDTAAIKEAVQGVAQKDRNPFQRRYLGRVRVYLANTGSSPFSGGIWKTYIVLPRTMWEDWGERECATVLCHEFMHIKSGHILWLTAFKFLTFLWWPNPLIYLCGAALKEDIELACDESCILYAGIPRRGYAGVLLAMAGQLCGGPKAATASFLGRSDFTVMKRRIGYIASRCDQYHFLCRRRRSFGVFLGSMALTCTVIAMTSYPRYTVMREIGVYDEHINQIAYDTQMVQEAFCVKDGKLLVNQEKFGEFISAEGITDDYVYVCFDTIMKVPGMGGGGNTGMVNVSDTEDIYYLAAETFGNRLRVFCLKYLL